LIGKWREKRTFEFKYFNVYNNYYSRQGKNCSNFHKYKCVVNTLIFYTIFYNIKKYKQTRPAMIACTEFGYKAGTTSYQRSECFTEYWFHNTIEVCMQKFAGGWEEIRKNTRGKRKPEKFIKRARKKTAEKKQNDR